MKTKIWERMGIIEEQFSEHAKIIMQRRENDSELDEICRDFELLAADLQKEGPEDGSWKSELESSIAALKSEILSKLQFG